MDAQERAEFGYEGYSSQGNEWQVKYSQLIKLTALQAKPTLSVFFNYNLYAIFYLSILINLQTSHSVVTFEIISLGILVNITERNQCHD